MKSFPILSHISFYNVIILTFTFSSPLQLEGSRCIFPYNDLVFFRPSPLHSFVVPPLSSIKFPYMYGSISELYILFCLYISLFLCRAILFSSLWFCSICWYLVGKLLLCSYFSKLTYSWTPVFHINIGMSLLSSSNNPMVFLLRFHWMYNFLWEELT